MCHPLSDLANGWAVLIPSEVNERCCYIWGVFKEHFHGAMVLGQGRTVATCTTDC